eukprot:Clim_evm62s11 gene=Clim_evmTU62s11
MAPNRKGGGKKAKAMAAAAAAAAAGAKPAPPAKVQQNGGPAAENKGPRGDEPLPAKEQNLFRQIVNLYERKQYKKGIKTCEQVLKKFPNHGETLAMKGLLCMYLNRKTEAYELVRLGLRNNLKSHICWHVYGLLWRMDKNYDEAVKSYNNALKWDKENINILRDLAYLQIQIRDEVGVKDTAHRLLELRPQQRANWLRLAISYHLLGRHSMAIKILEQYEKIQASENQSNNKADYEESELQMYMAMIVEESGDVDAAIEQYKQSSPRVIDRRAFKENMLRLFRQKGDTEKALTIAKQLFKENSDCMDYLEQYAAVKGFDNQGHDVKEEVRFYNNLSNIYPRSLPLQVLPLIKLPADEETFVQGLDEFIRKGLNKGVPSLFNTLKPLYNDPKKAAVIEKTVLKIKDDTKPEANAGAVSSPISAYVWCLNFLALHYSQSESPLKAVAEIDEALRHTPTLLDLYTTKAEILRKHGAMLAAAHNMNIARGFDTADRYLNSACGEAMLNAGLVDDAEKVLSLFTRTEDKKEDPKLTYLYDMQCMWYERDAGRAHRRAGRIGPALKKFHAMLTHFNDFQEDQFDFHSYCMRKMTLRAYVKMLRFEDNLRSHEYFGAAAAEAIAIYIDLADHPEKYISRSDDLDEEMKNLSLEEQKKLKRKRAKEAARKAEEEAAKKEKEAKESKANKKDGEEDEKKDDDPDGAKLMGTKTPLEDAMKFLTPLTLLKKDSINTHVLAVEVYVRREKLLLALKHLLAAHRIDANNAKLHPVLVFFGQALEAKRSKINTTVLAVLDDGFAELLKPYGADSVKDVVAKFGAEQARNSLSHTVAAAKAALILEQSSDASKKQADALIAGYPVAAGKGTPSVTLAEALEALSTLSSEASREQFKEACRAVFPLCEDFGYEPKDEAAFPGTDELLDALESTMGEIVEA